MDIGFLIIAAVLLILGIIGCIVPMLPGPPLGWAGLLLAYFSSWTEYGIKTLIITGIIAVVVTVLDTFLPALMTKKTNGSKAASRGATVGIIVGLFMGPFGVILGPFCGALLGELIHNSEDFSKAIKVAWGSFLGFLFGTGLKLITVICFIWIFVLQIVK
ncbi:MAG: DUF456 domain-containing protein [Treponema sp.]|nr:DUF456 domain-containing protein [Treponema sp.]